MKKTIERIAGDTSGIAYELSVYRFEGADDGASAYIQAALHGGELPGVVAIHSLMPMLRKAEQEGRIRGRITVVPSANPIGRAQYLFGELNGRFHFGTQTNFNRDFPILTFPDQDVAEIDSPTTADERLKARLVALSMGHDIVLDLHCDDEGVPYLYVPTVLWPAMQDCAAAMQMHAVLLWNGDCGRSFDQAAIDPYLNAPAEISRFDRRVVTTVEYRGLADVDPNLAEADALGLYRLLVRRGVIEDEGVAAGEAFSGIAAPIEHVEMVKAPCAGAALYHVKPGDRVVSGQKLATIVHSPGEEDGATDVHAPQPGFVLTRRDTRAIYKGEDLLKLVGHGPSATHKPGALED